VFWSAFRTFWSAISVRGARGHESPFVRPHRSSQPHATTITLQQQRPVIISAANLPEHWGTRAVPCSHLFTALSHAQRLRRKPLFASSRSSHTFNHHRSHCSQHSSHITQCPSTSYGDRNCCSSTIPPLISSLILFFPFFSFKGSACCMSQMASVLHG